jgi:hypothetical protein
MVSESLVSSSSCFLHANKENRVIALKLENLVEVVNGFVSTYKDKLLEEVKPAGSAFNPLCHSLRNKVVRVIEPLNKIDSEVDYSQSLDKVFSIQLGYDAVVIWQNKPIIRIGSITPYLPGEKIPMFAERFPHFWKRIEPFIGVSPVQAPSLQSSEMNSSISISPTQHSPTFYDETLGLHLMHEESLSPKIEGDFDFSEVNKKLTDMIAQINNRFLRTEKKLKYLTTKSLKTSLILSFTGSILDALNGRSINYETAKNIGQFALGINSMVDWLSAPEFRKTKKMSHVAKFADCVPPEFIDLVKAVQSPQEFEFYRLAESNPLSVKGKYCKVAAPVIVQELTIEQVKAKLEALSGRLELKLSQNKKVSLLVPQKNIVLKEFTTQILPNLERLDLDADAVQKTVKLGSLVNRIIDLRQMEIAQSGKSDSRMLKFIECFPVLFIDKFRAFLSLEEFERFADREKIKSDRPKASKTKRKALEQEGLDAKRARVERPSPASSISSSSIEAEILFYTHHN